MVNRQVSDIPWPGMLSKQAKLVQLRHARTRVQLEYAKVQNVRALFISNDDTDSILRIGTFRVPIASAKYWMTQGRSSRYDCLGAAETPSQNN